MLHLSMDGVRGGREEAFSSTLFFEETYRATGICAAIATQMVAEGSVPSGYRWASQIPDVDLFMGRFLRQGYSISRTWQRRFNGAGKGAAA